MLKATRRPPHTGLTLYDRALRHVSALRGGVVMANNDGDLRARLPRMVAIFTRIRPRTTERGLASPGCDVDSGSLASSASNLADVAPGGECGGQFLLDRHLDHPSHGPVDQGAERPATPFTLPPF